MQNEINVKSPYLKLTEKGEYFFNFTQKFNEHIWLPFAKLSLIIEFDLCPYPL